MFCPNCGQELKDPNQRFCQNCGSEIQHTSGVPRSHQTPGYTDYPATQQKPVKEGRPGAHSKKCLAFSIPSIGMAVAMLAIAGLLRLFYLLGMPLPLFIMGVIIGIIINIVGLTFGVFSRINGKEATKSEPENAVETVGSIFAIFGIIGNAILIIVAVIVVAIALV